MEYIKHLPYVRYSLRGISSPATTTATSSALTEAYFAMANSDWVRLDEQGSNLPPHSYSQPSEPKDTFDACKYCAEWDKETYTQRACMTAVCYVMPVPSEAVESGAKILSVSANLSGDRWLADGAVLSAWLSDSETPPKFAKIVSKTSPIDGIVSSPADPPEEDDDTSPWVAPLRKKTVVDNSGSDSQCTATLTIGQAAKKYLHLCLRIAVYTSHRKAWIEGGALISGPSIQVSFDSDLSSNTDEFLEFPIVYDSGFFKTGVPIVREFDGKEGCLFQTVPSNSSISPNAVINASVGVVIPSGVDSDGNYKPYIDQESIWRYMKTAMELGSRSDNAANLSIEKIKTNSTPVSISKPGAKAFYNISFPTSVDSDRNCNFGDAGSLYEVGAGIATYDVNMFFIPGYFDGRSISGFSLGEYIKEPPSEDPDKVFLVSLYCVRDYVADFTKIGEDGSSITERHIISPGFYYRDWPTLNGEATELPVLPAVPDMEKYEIANVPMEKIATFDFVEARASYGNISSFEPKYLSAGRGALVAFLTSRPKELAVSYNTNVALKDKPFRLY